MASRFWVGGSGTWDLSDTTHWSATSGGAAGASAPTSADNVTFNSNSGASPTITLGANVHVADIVTTGVSGTMTLVPSGFTIRCNSFNPSTTTLNLGTSVINTASWNNAATTSLTASSATLNLDPAYHTSPPANAIFTSAVGLWGTINAQGATTFSSITGGVTNLNVSTGVTVKFGASVFTFLMTNLDADGATINSTTNGSAYGLRASGTVSLVGATIRDIRAGGGATWTCNGTDSGNNFGVTFTSSKTASTMTATQANDASAGTTAWTNSGFSVITPQTRWQFSATNLTGYKDFSVMLVKGGVISSTDKADLATTYTTSGVEKTYGSASDLWGLSLTKADIEAADFGFAIRSQDSAGGTSQWLKFTSWDFVIPTGATILGVEVVVNRFANPSPWKAQVQYASMRVTYSTSVEYTMSATAQSYTLTGYDILFHRGYTLASQVGAFTLTGINTILQRGRALLTATGTFALTGVDILVHRTVNLLIATGVFTVTGYAVNFATTVYNLITTGRDFDLVGYDITSHRTINLISSAASFVLTGAEASFIRGKYLTASAASFVLTGKTFAVNLGKTLAASVLSLIVSPKNVTFAGSGGWKMSNTDKPASIFINVDRVYSGETWETIATTWDNEVRTWLQAGQLLENPSKPVTSLTNVSKT